jgi:hypothetical protein
VPYGTGHRQPTLRVNIPEAEIQTGFGWKVPCRERISEGIPAVFASGSGSKQEMAARSGLPGQFRAKAIQPQDTKRRRIFVAPTKIMYDYLWSRAIIRRPLEGDQKNA